MHNDKAFVMHNDRARCLAVVMPQNNLPKPQMVQIQAVHYLTQWMYACRSGCLMFRGLMCAPKVAMLNDSQLVLDSYSDRMLLPLE